MACTADPSSRERPLRTLDALLDVLSVGATRVGATATEATLEDFRARKAAG
ncbi:MAG TPA: hypothetical protein VJ986_05300 [Gaiellaceae bacterium]|nr:hypothetical protein [Gaiellaceae bacterium]